MRMAKLKAATPTDDAPVTMLELFFDLVFVYSITQLTALVLDGHGLGGYVKAAAVLVVTWWMYDGYAWLANNVGPTTLSTRLPMLVAMTCFLLMATAVPDVFGSGAWVYAIAYLVVVLLHAFSFARSTLGGSAMAIRGILPLNLTMCLGLVVAAILGARWGWVGWIVAVVIPVIAVVRRRESGFTLRPEHFVERHQLLIIIALGETIIAIGVSAQGQLADPGVLLTVILSMALISALWWVYFGSGDDERGLHALEEMPSLGRELFGFRAYSLGHLVHIAGLVLLAAGLHVAVHAPAHRLTWQIALTLSGGCAVYLIGEAAFLRSLGLASGVRHAVGALACLPIAALGALVNGAAQVGALVIAILGLVMLAGRENESALVTASS